MKFVYDIDRKILNEDCFYYNGCVNLHSGNLWKMNLLSERQILKELKNHLEFYPISFIKNIKLQAIVAEELVSNHWYIITRGKRDNYFR